MGLLSALLGGGGSGGGELEGYDTTFAAFADLDYEHADAQERVELFGRLDVQQRCRYIVDFLQQRGLAVSATQEGLLVIDRWLRQARGLRLAREDPITLPREWAAFAVDLGIVCGEVSAASEQTRYWALYSEDPPCRPASPAMLNVPGTPNVDPALQFVNDARLQLTGICWSKLGVRSWPREQPVARLLDAIRRRREPRSTPVGFPPEEDWPRLTQEQAKEQYARYLAGGDAQVAAGVPDLRPDQIARYLEHADPGGEIESSSQFVVIDAASAAEARAIVERDEDDGGEPSARLRAFAEQFLDIWPYFTAHPEVSSPYEDDLLEVADSTTLASELYGSPSLIGAMVADLERLTSAHGLYLFWGTTGELVEPENRY